MSFCLNSIIKLSENVISEITFSNDLMEEFKLKLVEYLLSEKYFDRKKINKDDFNEKYKGIINLISINAPVKSISENKNENEIISIFNEIIEEIKKIDLKHRIETLEDKVALNLDEKLYSELLSLRNQLKSG